MQLYITHTCFPSQTPKNNIIVRFGLLKAATILTKRRARINGEIKVFIEIISETYRYLMILERFTG